MKPGEFKEKIVLLLKANASPHEIALGMAIGVFIAITPLYGLHTVMFIISVFLVPRANKLAMLAGTNISLPPTIPFITWAGYAIGRAALGSEYPPLSWKMFEHITWQSIAELYYPLFVGSMVLGIVCSIVVYCVTLLIVTKVNRKRCQDSIIP